MHVLVVSKITALTHARKNGVQLSCYREQTLRRGHDAHHSMLAELTRDLEEHGITADFIHENDLDGHKGAYDYIISLGGDGTFLTAAQHFPDHTLIGINSDKSRSVKRGSIGALTNVDKANMSESLTRLQRGEFEVDEWPRLCATVNGKLLPNLATNEIYFGNLISYSTCHFSMKYGSKKEHFHGSSGLVVSTGIGSTAWYRNEGGTPFTRDLRAFGFIVRAPHMKRQPVFTRGMVPQHQTLKVQCHDDGYIMSFDSKPHQVSLKHGDIVRIGINKQHPVRVIKFS